MYTALVTTPLSEVLTQYPSLLVFCANNAIPFATKGKDTLETLLSLQTEEQKEQLFAELSLYMDTTKQLPFSCTCSLEELTKHIYTHYHIPTRTMLADITQQLQHSLQIKHSPELEALYSAFVVFAEGMEPHLVKEEDILFPMIIGLETTNELNYKQALVCPLQVMDKEHEMHEHNLTLVLQASEKVQSHEDSKQAIYAIFLLTLEHVHVENNILFERIRNY